MKTRNYHGPRCVGSNARDGGKTVYMARTGRRQDRLQGTHGTLQFLRERTTNRAHARMDLRRTRAPQCPAMGTALPPSHRELGRTLEG